jgi:UDP-N-acetylmuramate--alanine ligase
MTHVHFIGIGGSGLSAIARVLLERGYRVSGSDRQPTPLAQALESAGARVFIGHRAENVPGAQLVIRSSAVTDDNPEVQAALRLGIPVLKRSEFLGQLIAEKACIAVAGTHGKTTTTAMLAWALHACGQDPSYVIGGHSANLGANAHAGNGPHFVIEADEYDRMFLGLSPTLAVITNIEHDHPDCYPTAEDFYQAFRQFAARLAPGGSLLACLDDPGAARLASELEVEAVSVITYAIDAPAKYTARRLAARPGAGYRFEAARAGQPLAQVDLQVPGEHNVRNALAALAACDLLGLPLEQAAAALGSYRGTGRRFELRGEAGGVAVIDDYAHHPTEIRATLAAARARYPGRRLWAAWQPHTYSRTRALFEAFSRAFEQADAVIVTQIYAAREPAPADGFSGLQVAAAIRHPQVHYQPELAQAARFLLENLQPGDVLLVLSAGDADQISARVLAGLSKEGSLLDG